MFFPIFVSLNQESFAMKKIALCLLAFLFAFALGGHAQIEEEILQSKSSRIERGRAFLLEKFLERDYDKMREAKDYLMGLEDDHYLAFRPMEVTHILIWTRDFDELTAYMRQMDSAYQVRISQMVMPASDQLTEQIYRRGMEDEHLLRFNIEEANLPAEDKDFLTLFLDWNLKPFTYKDQQDWNEQSEQFLETYPNSDYEWFVRNVIYTELSHLNRNKWAWGMGMDLCGGFLTGKLSEISQPIFGLGLSFNLAYKKLLIDLGYDIVISKTKIDQLYGSGVYPAGKRDNLINFYLDFSLPVLSGKEWDISPLLGIGGCWDTYPTSNGNYHLSDLDTFYPTVRTGLKLDIKTHGAFEDGVIRIKYHCGFSNHNGFSTIHMISVGGAGLMNFRRYW